MSAIWEDFKAIEEEFIIEIATERREENIDLYDAALAISPFDRPDFIEKLIIEKRINANDRIIITGKPLLFLAIVENRYETTKLLIKYGADVSYVLDNKNYLFWALFDNCDLKLIELLIQTGGFELDGDAFNTLFTHCSEDTINSLVQDKNLDLIVKNVMDEPISLFQVCIEKKLYSVAKSILNSDCPKTLKLLIDDDYLELLGLKIERPHHEFHSSAVKKRPRAPLAFSKEALIEIKHLLELKLTK